MTIAVDLGRKAIKKTKKQTNSTDIFSKSYFYFINHHASVEAILCVQKKKETFQDLIETDNHECATIICLYTHSEKIKLIDHMLLKFA